MIEIDGTYHLRVFLERSQMGSIGQLKRISRYRTGAAKYVSLLTVFGT